MYSFQPLADLSTVHNGLHAWYWVIGLAALWFLIVCREESLGDIIYSLFLCSFFVGPLTWVIHTLSYSDVPPINEPVSATFVGYQPEGYSEDRQSGKTRYRADVHKMYVIYRINKTGNDVILEASAGTEYPQHATLYKN